jgi:hypothetical protein
MFQRGSSPIRLSQLDVTPMVQAAQTLEAANVNLNNAINQSILSFAQKQEQKKQDKIGIQAIQNMFGLDETTAKAMYKDDVVRDAFVMKQKADADLVRKQREQVELEILQSEFEASKADEEALQKAISVNIDTEGNLDKSGVESAYLEFGGTNLKALDLFKQPGEIKVDKETGIITQDGVYKGQVATKLLLGDNDDDDSVPSEDVTPTFNTIEEAEAANLPLGTRVIIGGRDAIIG